MKKILDFSIKACNCLALGFLLLPLSGVAKSSTIQHSPLQVIVNSNLDGPVQAEEVVTLREAIALVNGTLTLDKLSDRQRSHVTTLNNAPSQIKFNLPPQATTINLTEILPPLISPVIIDGTTQSGYSDTPVVTITPTSGKEVFRGFTVAVDNVTIRGLSLYGFTSLHGATASTPPADIFIAPLEESKSQPPKNVVIENNWLGVFPATAMVKGEEIDEKVTQSINPQAALHSSAFGVSVFNSLGTTIQHNHIGNHDGSAIITSIRAENLHILDNMIEGNGFAGMPDAIRLEGIVPQAQITANLIQNNAGSAVYLFKPSGSVKIQDNTITHNGQHLQRAAIYLMGNGHEVVNNKITEQSGPGVVVAAYPKSVGNRIQNNQFAHLAGLSIDLVTQQRVGVQDYQQGDGINPLANSFQRHRKTGNFGIDAPRFKSPEFFINPDKGTVTLDGVATPGAVVDIYRVTEDYGNNGPLNEAIATVNVGKDGSFAYVLGNIKPGERLSAIATHPQYGTSEPAENTVMRSLSSN